MSKPRELKLWQAIIPIVTMTVFILLSLLVWKVPIHLAIFFELVLTSILALTWRFSWEELEEMMIEGFKSVGRVLMILILIGILIGIWIGAGTVPAMIYYGLQVISPQYFIVTAFLLCSLVSLAIGTAIGTVSTIGLAMISIGIGLQMPLPLIAGAVISGAYFGDRMSPVSSIAIMTAHSAGVGIYEMVKHMIYTVIPPFLISGCVYWILGLKYAPSGGTSEQISLLLNTFDQYFQISILMLIPPILIIIFSIKRMPTIPNLVISILVTLVLGLLISGKTGTFLIKTMFTGYASNTGITVIDQLLSRGGLVSMLELIALIILTSLLGGLFGGMGILRVLLTRLLGRVQSVGQLILATIISSTLTAMLGCNQLLAVFLPGKMLLEKYDQMGVSRKDLARALGDSGLILSPLIPWNINGLMMAGTIGVSTLEYFPFAFLPLLLPIVAIIYGLSGLTIEKKAVSASSRS